MGQEAPKQRAEGYVKMLSFLRAEVDNATRRQRSRSGRGLVWSAHAPEGSPGDVVAADVGVLLGGAQGARGCRRVKSQRLIDACCQIWELLAKAGCVISVE